MTKTELTTFIMSQSTEYKKTNLMKMHHADLQELAQSLSSPEVAENTVYEPVIQQDNSTSETEEIVAEVKGEGTIYDVAATAFESHKKLVKGPRLDKEEFRKVAIQKIIDTLADDESSSPDAVALSVINQLLQNKTYFCPINDIEKAMLETIPKMEAFTGIDSVIDGKTFLQKVGDIHGIAVSTTRALMVSLCKKGFYEIKGVKSGQKKTTLHLQERGINYLDSLGLLNTATNL